jgi:hypothetical protein
MMRRWIVMVVMAVAWTVPAGSGEYKPTFGDMMNAFVQPRHIKLGLAGQAGNWPLAAHELHELDEAFAAIKAYQPVWNGKPMAQMIAQMTTGPRKDVGDAIAAKDAKRFGIAFDQLTNSCNACHERIDKPFLKITAPQASPFADQTFKP